ncbi:hypothetical protein FA95DRAFT_1613482 [Auriscalpium vulgare]|uniref:Uncharacterized protein n=1 Tax=Auriscalpium vulgare TaxID=40419 RepID=A0ACB8R444_9AGAM|nr:hypothetical protein FA95DRAFT_1613482 [Auriscalpium vulgare]
MATAAAADVSDSTEASTSTSGTVLAFDLSSLAATTSADFGAFAVPTASDASDSTPSSYPSVTDAAFPIPLASPSSSSDGTPPAPVVFRALGPLSLEVVQKMAELEFKLAASALYIRRTSAGKELHNVAALLTADHAQMKTLEDCIAMLEREVQRIKERQRCAPLSPSLSVSLTRARAREHRAVLLLDPLTGGVECSRGGAVIFATVSTREWRSRRVRECVADSLASPAQPILIPRSQHYHHDTQQQQDNTAMLTTTVDSANVATLSLTTACSSRHG